MFSTAALDEVDHPHPRIKTALRRIYALHRKSIGQRLHGSAYERLLDHFGRPQDRLPPVIHMAGTNGKGSTTALLRAIYAAAGYRVHAYTSPHIFVFNERIELAVTPISDEMLLATIDRMDAAIVALGDTVSFFEYVTAMALLLFSEIPADVCLLETGMGGRLDPTNVVSDKALTILTKISYDHMRFLGDTLPAIAAEKAAIMRLRTPCVVAPQYAPNDVLPVFQDQAQALSAPLYRAGSEWHVQATGDGMTFCTGDQAWVLPRPSLAGDHQLENAGNALMAVQLLQPRLPVSDAAIITGLQTARWPARLQRIENPALTTLLPDTPLWYDGAHNDTGALAMATQCAAWQATGKTVHLVVALGGGKNAGDFVAPFLPHISTLTFVDMPVGRAPRLASDMISEYAGTLPARCAETPTAALRMLPPGADAVVLFCGSLYFASRVLG